MKTRTFNAILMEQAAKNSAKALPNKSSDIVTAFIISLVLSFAMVDTAFNDKKMSLTQQAQEDKSHAEWSTKSASQKTDAIANGITANQCQRDSKCAGYIKRDGSFVRFNNTGHVLDSRGL